MISIHSLSFAGVPLLQMPRATMKRWHAQVMYRNGNTGIMDGKMEGEIFVSVVQIA